MDGLWHTQGLPLGNMETCGREPGKDAEDQHVVLGKRRWAEKTTNGVLPAIQQPGKGETVQPAGLPRWCSGKGAPCQCRRHKRHGLNPSLGKTPWSRKWQPNSVLLPGECPGPRSLWVTVPGVTKSQI